MSKTKVLDKFCRVSGVTIKCNPEEGKTQQQFKEECDVNIIVERYTKTGLWGSTIKPGTRVAMYGDFANAPDFQQSMDRINQAQADFDALPSRLRKRFNNSPAELLAFISDKNNREEAVILGLIDKPSVPASPAAELPGITPGTDGKS